jgi:bifunctional UDP-N-acetylglucosamine pyrophosphorylase/glucosamine-1-phosphate N-acetyltransferase
VLSTVDGEVTGVFEKPSNPPSDLVNAGAYVFPEEARNWLSVPMSERDERELTDVLAKTANERRVTAVTLDRWMDVGRPWELLDATEWRLRELDATVAGDVSEDARLDGRVAVESGATVEAGATVEGPTLVRAGATVSRDAHVRGSTMVGRGVTVGPGAEVENSVLMSGVRLGEGAHVSDSVLASEVDVGAETTVANRRSDGEPVRVTVKGERVSTGRRAFGAVLGPGAQTGTDSSIAAGVTLAASATTAPGEVVTRDR